MCNVTCEELLGVNKIATEWQTAPKQAATSLKLTSGSGEQPIPEAALRRNRRKNFLPDYLVNYIVGITKPISLTVSKQMHRKTICKDDSALSQIIKRITTIVKEGMDIATAFKEGNPIKILIEVVTSIGAIIDNAIKIFTVDLVKLIEDMAQNLLDLVNYEKWWLSTYNAYNMCIAISACAAKPAL